jgi:Ras-related protein Rab-32
MGRENEDQPAAVVSILWCLDNMSFVGLKDAVLLSHYRDIAGHERFGSMTRVYYKYAMAAIIVFDLSRPATFYSVPKWYDDLLAKVELPDQRPLPVILLANKCDLPVADDVHLDAVMDFVHSKNLVGFFSTSAKDNINIEDAVEALVDHILSSQRTAMPLQNGVVLTENPPVGAKDQASSGRCCR